MAGRLGSRPAIISVASAEEGDARMTTAETVAPASSAQRVSRRRRWPVVLAFLAPALLLYFAFVLLPIVQGMRYSLYDWNGLESLTDFIGLENFVDAFTDTVFLRALRHNVIILVLSLLLQLPFALSLAVLLDQRLRGRAAMRMFFFAPYVLSEVVTAVVWRQIMRPDGLLNAAVSGGAGSEVEVLWLASPSIVLYSVFFVVSWKYFGFHMILMLAGLQQIPDELEEAAAIDGATWWQTFRYVTLPLLGPAVRVSVFLSMIGSLQLFDLVWVMTGGGPVNASNTMATYMIDWGFRRSQFGYASAVSVIVFGLSLLVALGYQRWVLSRDIEGALTAMGK
ncbi:MAG TPA: sugar ABC transporter permease [Acidimicrobiia bacterium]|jgi:raffinose/stachyose/melibiose transport system permease protein